MKSAPLSHLMLPPWLGPDRKSLENLLPRVNLPSLQTGTEAKNNLGEI